MATRSRPAGGSLFFGVAYVAVGVASFVVAIGGVELRDAPSIGLIVAGGTTLVAFAGSGLGRWRQNRHKGGEIGGTGAEPGPLPSLDSLDETGLS